MHFQPGYSIRKGMAEDTETVEKIEPGSSLQGLQPLL